MPADRTDLLRCPWCDDTGIIITAVLWAEHHEMCSDTTCHRDCPIPVWESDYEPCGHCDAAARRACEQ